MKKELLEMLNKLEETNDVDFYEIEDTLHVNFNDFEGFNEDWEEIDRDYENGELVNQVLDFLENNCKGQEGDFYKEYIFDDFNVIVGYSSFDI